MLNEAIKNRLKDNWGERANAMDCMAEIRLMDPLTDWACWIIAMNPDDEDHVMVILRDTIMIEVCDWSMDDIESQYNRDGEPPIVDREFRPRRASDIYKTLVETI